MTAVLTFTFDPDEARDDHGRWTDGGGGGVSAATQAARGLADGYRADTVHSFKAEDWQTARPKLLTPAWSAQRQAARDWADEHVISTKDASVASYVVGSSGLNHALRDGDAPPEFYQQIAPVLQGIDSEIAASHVDVNTVAYRGQPSSVLDGLKVGDTYTDKGYTSTTLLQRTASGFPEATPVDGSRQVVEVHIPAESNVGVPADRTEHELILARDSTFRVDALGEHPVISYLPPK